MKRSGSPAAPPPRPTEASGRWGWLSERCRRAAADDRSPWVMLACLAVGLALADAVIVLFTRAGTDLEAARALGVVSQTILEGYPKSRDLNALRSDFRWRCSRAWACG